MSSGFSIKVSATGIGEVIIKLRGARARMEDLTPAMKQGAVMMLRSVDQNFRQSGRPIPWKPLKFATLKRKLRQGYSPLPLTRTGALRRSITQKTFRQKFQLGTSIKYGAVHQFGGGNNIPARPYLVFQRQDVKRINKLVLEYIAGGKVRLG